MRVPEHLCSHYLIVLLYSSLTRFGVIFGDVTTISLSVLAGVSNTKRKSQASTKMAAANMMCRTRHGWLVMVDKQLAAKTSLLSYAYLFILFFGHNFQSSVLQVLKLMTKIF